VCVSVLWRFLVGQFRKCPSEGSIDRGLFVGLPVRISEGPLIGSVRNRRQVIHKLGALAVARARRDPDELPARAPLPAPVLAHQARNLLDLMAVLSAGFEVTGERQVAAAEG